MGLSSVVFVGHDDGGLLALKATERIQASPDSSKVNICSNLLAINYFDLTLLSFDFDVSSFYFV